MKYEKPYFQLDIFDSEDIVVTSDQVTITPEGDGGELEIEL